MPATKLDSLLAAISRAEKSGITDEDAEQINLGRDFGHEMMELCMKYTEKFNLKRGNSVKIMAILIGLHTKHSNSSTLQKLGILQELTHIMLSTALEGKV